MRLFDFIREGWTLNNRYPNSTIYYKNLNNLTSKDIELLSLATDIYGFEDNNIPLNFTENQGIKVRLNLGYNSTNNNVYITIKPYTTKASGTYNITHLRYKVDRVLIDRDLYLNYINTTDTNQENFLFINNPEGFLVNANGTLKNIYGGSLSGRINLLNTNPGYIILSPLIPFNYSAIYSTAFNDTSTPYTTINAGTYTYSLNLFTPHYLCGYYHSTFPIASVNLKIYHEVSTDNGSTWNILQSFSIWNSSSYISSFILPLTYNTALKITNRRIRYVAVTNLNIHYFYIISINQPNSDIYIT